MEFIGRHSVHSTQSPGLPGASNNSRRYVMSKSIRLSRFEHITLNDNM